MTTRLRSFSRFKFSWPVLLAMAAAAGIAVLSGPLAPSAAEDQKKTEPVEWSEPARLAPKSLLLDAALLDQKIIAVGERGHVLVSEDGGGNWTQVRTPTRSLLTATAVVDGRYAWAVGHDAVILYTADGGSTWSRQHDAPEEGTPLLDVWFENKNHGIAVGAYGLFLETRDGGTTWESRPVDEEERHWNAIAGSQDGTLYVAAESGVVFRSSDKGKSWDPLETPYKGSFLGVICLSDGPVLVFGLRGNVFRSADRGDTWQEIATDTTVSLLGATQCSDGKVVIVGLSGTLLISQDKGLSFHTVNRPDRQALAAVVERNPGGLLLFGENGVNLVDDASIRPSK